uniref:Pentapeptide repeat-containing protein n=1 Tax=Candidatus Kentrum sp. LFY TaxID=2126342 RepID=A0A450V186_9GAMM|nr:MAG: Pentapeptide repeat-containing protein [Candidatus Kentron sp. LFY]
MPSSERESDDNGQGFPVRRFYQTEFLLALPSSVKALLWSFYHFSGLRHVREMASARRPNTPDYEKPPTLVLWIIGVYVALYGIAATHYEAKLDRVENRMGALASQLATQDDEAFKKLIARIPRIQGMETPLEPSLLWPFEENSVFSSHFFSCPEGDASSNKDDPRYFVIHSLLCEGRNPEILQWTRETIKTWKEKLAGVELYRIDLSGAWLFQANLSGASLWIADLSGAWLNKANLSGAGLRKADLSEAVLWGADLSGARLLYIENWQEIRSIENANILGIRHAPEGFRDWASKKGAVEMEPAAWRAFRKNGYETPKPE